LPFTYEYPRPSLTVDALVFTRARPRAALLIQRGHEPFKGCWAIPGGFVEMDEDLEPAARRELEEETGLTGVSLFQFRTYGDPRRDPRGRTVSIVHVGEVDRAVAVDGRDDARDARFFEVAALPLPLAFDHEKIVKEALAWLDARSPSS